MSKKDELKEKLLSFIHSKEYVISIISDKPYIYIKFSTKAPYCILFFDKNDNLFNDAEYNIEPGYLEIYEEIFGLTSRDKEDIVQLEFPDFRSKRGLIK